jgi:hypothetical protein
MMAAVSGLQARTRQPAPLDLLFFVGMLAGCTIKVKVANDHPTGHPGEDHTHEAN